MEVCFIKLMSYLTYSIQNVYSKKNSFNRLDGQFYLKSKILVTNTAGPKD